MKVMISEKLSKGLCEVYCRYYKPSKQEDLACMGFVITKRLIELGFPISFPVCSGPPADTGGPERPGNEITEKLINQVCTVCPFQENDCDFIGFYRTGRSASEQERLMPCGGFIFLSLLLDSGVICIDDIRDIE
jgi:hypothetical protein